MLDYIAQVLKQPAQQHGIIAEPFLVLDPIENWQISKTLDKWTKVTHCTEKCVSPKIQIGSLHIILIS